MPNFSFTALNNEGREIKGILDAPDLSDARRQLRAKTLMPLELQLSKTLNPNAVSLSWLSDPSRYLWTRRRDKQFFFRQMALMIQSGHRVRHALETCSDLVERQGLTLSVRRMITAIDAGSSLADALRAEGKRFPAFVPALVHAGEKSGTLDQILGEIAESLERAAALRNTLLRALVFPLITLVVAFGLLCFIVLWLVPIISNFIARQGADIHWTMQILVNITEFLLSYGLWISGGIAAITFATLAAYTTQQGKLRIDRALLSMPIFGKTMRYFEMSRFGGIGKLLLQSGLRQVEMLRILSDVTQNESYRQRYLTAADDVLTGEKVSSALTGATFPPLVLHMISVGEASGSLVNVMERVSLFFADEVETRINVTISTLVPAVTILVGVVVGTIYISVVLTILGAYNTIR